MNRRGFLSLLGAAGTARALRVFPRLKTTPTWTKPAPMFQFTRDHVDGFVVDMSKTWDMAAAWPVMLTLAPRWREFAPIE